MSKKKKKKVDTCHLFVMSEAAKLSNERILYDAGPSSHTEDETGFDAIYGTTVYKKLISSLSAASS